MRTSQNDSNQRGLFISLILSLSIDATLITEKLIELTNVTRTMLHDVEGELWIPWATAQQVSARQKVELSIRYISVPSTILGPILISCCQ